MTSFNLHQTCENLIYAVRLVFTLKNNKQHNLSKLMALVRKYSSDFRQVFPQNTVEEKCLFLLIKAAYVEARYNPDFFVTREDIEALMSKIELLFKVVKTVCEDKIKEYGDKG